MLLTEPPSKRRRLVSAAKAAASLSHLPGKETSMTTRSSKISTCTSCHRALNLKSTGQAVICARCNASTCAVCSRTCDAASLSPPAPLQFISVPLPSSQPTVRQRMALGVRNTNSILQRRRVREEEEESDGPGDKDACGKNADEGCGRVVCRNCCLENPQSGSVTCHDCRERPRTLSTQIVVDAPMQ
ncbi:hypothetical protein OF83DRAFT_1262533 [Amylostereum chailletii]|nr:hypothetical protein OF83DRAFT_1262533 [Amylostereum chailletii]